MQIIELETVEDMLAHLDVMKFLYPDFEEETYRLCLQEMVPHNYRQVAVFEKGQCIALSGYWTNVKLWSKKYLELDNFVVHPDYRSKGVGKRITDYMDLKAKEIGASMIVLDAYVENFGAHKFYYAQGYVARGYHFIKFIK